MMVDLLAMRVFVMDLAGRNPSEDVSWFMYTRGFVQQLRNLRHVIILYIGRMKPAKALAWESSNALSNSCEQTL